jgi:UDP-N-acetylglucosamine 2-epimerase (non-hydrolysing)
MLRILFVFGTRPEAIKLAPLIREMQEHPSEFEVQICTTGQHREMLKQVMDVFAIIPDHNLNLMQDNQTLPELSAKAITGVSSLVKELTPDWIIVQGDTTTAMCAALAGFYERVKVLHVEAGLRSHNKFSPFPEEINRKIASIVTDLHCAPTLQAKENLLKENIDENHIIITGNTVVDALLYITKEKDLSTPLLSTIADDKRIILVTAHRRENFGQPIINICNALKSLVALYHDIVIIYPVHANPNVKNVITRELAGIERIILVEPQDYLTMVALMKKAFIILTDSGGLQEEAPTFAKPVLVMRDTTERPEAIAAGTARLIGTETKDIVYYTSELLDNINIYSSMSAQNNPFGDGNASKRICRAIIEYL